MYASKDVGHTYFPTFKIDVVRLEVDIAKKKEKWLKRSTVCSGSRVVGGDSQNSRDGVIELNTRVGIGEDIFVV